MAGRQAKIVTPPLLKKALRRVRQSGAPKRDLAVLLLSTHAGLRACEIAALDWRMVLDPRGRIGSCIELPDIAAKKGSGRRIPMSPELRRALMDLKPRGHSGGPVARSKKGGHLRANSLVNWFAAFYRSLGAEGCSSHSGRRTFITNAARNAHAVGATLRDVQILAGHKSIETTQRYIEGDSNAQRRLVGRLAHSKY